MEIKIEKGIPMPEKSKPKSKYPFDSIEVGDSFFTDLISSSTLYQIAYIWRKTNQNEWRFKAVKENEGARVWRVK